MGFHHYNHYPMGGLGLQSYTPENQRLEPPKSLPGFLEDNPKSWRFASDGFSKVSNKKHHPSCDFQVFGRSFSVRQWFRPPEIPPRPLESSKDWAHIQEQRRETYRQRRKARVERPNGKGCNTEWPIPKLFGICNVCIYIYIKGRSSCLCVLGSPKQQEVGGSIDLSKMVHFSGDFNDFLLTFVPTETWNDPIKHLIGMVTPLSTSWSHDLLRPPKRESPEDLREI